MLNRSLQIVQTLDPNTGVARLRASGLSTGAVCTTGLGTTVTAGVYETNASFVARIAGKWAAIARKSAMVPAFHDRWPLCPT